MQGLLLLGRGTAPLHDQKQLRWLLQLMLVPRVVSVLLAVTHQCAKQLAEFCWKVQDSRVLKSLSGHSSPFATEKVWVSESIDGSGNQDG